MQQNSSPLLSDMHPSRFEGWSLMSYHRMEAGDSSVGGQASEFPTEHADIWKARRLSFQRSPFKSRWLFWGEKGIQKKGHQGEKVAADSEIVAL